MMFDRPQTSSNILDHPEPTRHLPLQKNGTANSQMFRRLGVISGFRSRPVNDSIMASWTTASLPASDRNSLYDSVFRNTNQDLPWSDGSDGSDEQRTESPEPFACRPDTGFLDSDNDTVNMDSIATVGPVSPILEQQPQDTSWKCTEDDFPFLRDVTQALESPTPTPPPWSQTLEVAQEEIIPFFPPLFSKFGPISRSAKSSYKSSLPLRVTADEMMKPAHVTTVTPLCQPPLMNAHPVPSRFTNNASRDQDEDACQQKSLWQNQVTVLEQKAQAASTTDERLDVELLAVEMQISMKREELRQCADMQRAQRQASEYMRQQQERDNRIEQGHNLWPQQPKRS